MNTREDLIPLIGLHVEVRQDQERTLSRGTLMDVGVNAVFVERDTRGQSPASPGIDVIELGKISAIKYEREETLRGPFDGSRQHGD